MTIQIKNDMTWAAFQETCILALKAEDDVNGPGFVNQQIKNLKADTLFRVRIQQFTADPTTQLSRESLQEIADTIYANWTASRVVEPVAEQPKANNVCNKVTAAVAAVFALAAAIYMKTQM